MNREMLGLAMFEAQRFIDRGHDLCDSRPRELVFVSSPKESGAVRRASMDLTRALAAMRKPK